LVKSNLESAAVFLCSYTNLNHTNKNGMSALLLAVEKGHTELVKVILNKGASTNIQTHNDLKSPLHLAVENNNMDIIQEFVEFAKSNDGNFERPDFNIKNAMGDSPLSLAITFGNTALVPILIQGGADINARNGSDQTLLHQVISKYFFL
jgi:ankyrin repeat protein